MTPNASAAVVDRVVERRRAVALGRHYREFDGLAVRQIADRQPPRGWRLRTECISAPNRR
jgi:hypothetical protein